MCLPTAGNHRIYHVGKELRNHSKKNPFFLHSSISGKKKKKINESVHSSFKIPTYGLWVYALSPPYGRCIKGLKQFDISQSYTK